MSERDARLQSILVAYIEAAEAGHAPGRDELLARHPEFAAELAEFLDGRERIERAAVPLHQAAPSASEMVTEAPSEGQTAAPLGKVRYFGDYELLEEIARGGMGVVYKARQISLDRIVALKMILSGQFAGPEDVRRFHQEANAAANLDHPNIVPIYEVGEHEGQHYFSMKFIDGGSLATPSAAPADRMLLRRAAQTMVTVARAVHHAHQRRILHRDLKPSNILLDASGQPQVTDFGLAKRMEDDSRLTQSGAIVGTPSYMAPEQASGSKALTTAVDVHGLGAILYELVTGRPPFRAGTQVDTLMQVLHQEPASPRQINRAVDRDLEKVCLKCLHKEPGRRYDSAAALADDLQRWLDGEPVVARPIPAAVRAWKWARRRPALAALGATATIATAALFVLGMVYNDRLQRALGEVAEQKNAVAQAQSESDGLREESRRVLDHVHYMRDVDAAQRELFAGNLDRCEALLDSYLTSSLRGWEWDYLKRQCHQEALTVTGARCVAWSPDGRLLATAAPGAQFPGQRMVKGAWVDVQLRNAATGELVHTLAGEEGTIYGLAFSDKGDRLAVHRTGRIQVWDVAAKKPIATWKDEGTKKATAMAFRPDGKQIATFSGLFVHLYEATTGMLERRLPTTYRDWPITLMSGPLAYSPDSRLLAVCSISRKGIWEAATGNEVRSLERFDGDVTAVAFFPNGKRLLTCGQDRISRVWDVDTGQESHTLSALGEEVKHLAFSRDGRLLAAAGSGHMIRVQQTLNWRETASWWGHEEGVDALALSPDGSRLATVDTAGPIRIWDIRAVQERWPETFTAFGLTDIALSPDGTQFALARVSSTTKKDKNGEFLSGKVELCDAATGRRVRLVEQTTHPWKYHGRIVSWLKRVAFSPDGQRLAVIDASDRGPESRGVGLGPVPAVRIWDLIDGKQVLVLDQAGEQCAFSPDGRWIATLAFARPGEGRSGGTVRLWDAQTGAVVSTFRPSAVQAVTLAFSPDGSRVALGGKRLLLIDVVHGGLRPARGFDVNAECLAFSPDGRYLASAERRGDVRLWDIATGRLLRRLNVPSGRGRGYDLYNLVSTPNYLAFSPDGRRLAYPGATGTVHLHDVEGGQDLVVLKDFPDQVDRLFFSPDGRRLVAINSASIWHEWDASPLPDDVAFERLARSRMRELVDREVLTQSEVLQRVHEDAGLSEAARAVVLRLAETVEDDAGRFNGAAWAVVLFPGAGPAACEKALQRAETACRLEPDNADHENTRAAALYRVGRYQEALEVLHRCQAIRAAQKKKSEPGDLVFLAMACHHLGRPGEARDYLAEVRRMQKLPEGINQDEETLLREAEELIEGKGGP
jgi:WD40 repeat protein